MIREATAFLLDVLKPNLPEHGALQTKVTIQPQFVKEWNALNLLTVLSYIIYD